jgi:predicted Zn-ribbon and HTH transcriptional regulator
LEVAQIFRVFSEQLPALSADQRHAVQDIVNCRTEALGGHVLECDHCGHQTHRYNSCLNRHCPKCQSLNQARWIEARQKDLLPVQYFHLVFTIPGALHAVFRANLKLCYNLLFAAVCETLRQVALNPQRLGAQIGFTAVLHTWTQTLLFHPHLHCIVPGGGLNAHGTQWVSSKDGFFLPQIVLSLVFRAKLLSKLEKAIDKGKIRLPDTDPCALLREAALHKWVVYAKEPFAGPEQVVRYLGRYTHRIAISNHRLVSLQGGEVTFRFKDRADGNKQKLLTLDAVEFLRRFLTHILPKGFMRIRHFGFLANPVRKKSIALCRQLLAVEDQHDDCAVKDDPGCETWQQLLLRLTGVDVTLCPLCKAGHLIQQETIPKAPSKWFQVGRSASW